MIDEILNIFYMKIFIVKALSLANMVAFYQALKKMDISSSLHIFPYGGHGYTVNKNPGSANMWPEITLEWLREMKYIQ
jgi:dipeptidyl aminopeptidase/acylaminoacyl peptidase